MSIILCPLQTAAKQYKNNAALIYAKRTITYDNLHLYVSATHSHLLSLGIEPDDRVAILADNSIEYLIMLFALWRIKAVACLLNTRMPPATLQKHLQTIEAKQLFTTKDYKSGIKNIPTHDLNDFVQFSTNNQCTADIKISLNQTATMMFTSGTSNDAKIVVHSFGNHYFNAYSSNQNIIITPENGWLLSLPLYHVSGLSIFMRNILSGGTTIIPKQEETLSQALANYPVTHLSLVTTQLFHLLQNHDNLITLQKLEAILLGGSAIPASLIAECQTNELPIYISYGLTEMSSQVATSRRGGFNVKALKYHEIKITPSREIMVRGKALFQGYLLKGKIHPAVDSQGWFKTGDLGFLDEEQCLHLIGRKDHMFISGGENIYPEEIEKTLLNLAEIEQAIVVPQENAEFGYRPIAYLKFKNSPQNVKAQLTSYIKTSLESFKVPDHFFILPEVFPAPGLKINREKFLRFIGENKEKISELN